MRAGSVAYVTYPHKWLIRGERLVDDTPHIRVSLADVELPNPVRLTQYVFRMRRCAMTVGSLRWTRRPEVAGCRSARDRR